MNQPNDLTRIQKIVLLSLVAAMVILMAVVLALTLPGASKGETAQTGTDRTAETGQETAMGEAELTLEATPAPDPWIEFTEDAENPLPVSGYRHTLGEALTLHGTVRSNYPISSVSFSITCAYNNDNDVYPYEGSLNLKKQGLYTYHLTDAVGRDGTSLSDLIDFTRLQVGVNTLKLYASCNGIRKQELARIRFYVIGDEWIEMQKNQLNGSYDELMDFFGSEERFLYRFQVVNGRYTMADPDWEETYITTIAGYPAGSEWKVHIDLVPYLEEAFTYLETTYVRVQGTNGDSGIVKLADLILEYNGCFVSRYTSSLKAVSAHSFGTAFDINASMTPNKNTKENIDVINNDVRDHLTYNGTVTDGDIPYYSFTYDGEYANCSLTIPETCVNYLLYELSFYRAGFLWAHYYRNTSDGMHITMGEQVSGATHAGKNGLRKVKEYLDPVYVASATGETAADGAEIADTEEAVPGEETEDGMETALTLETVTP